MSNLSCTNSLPLVVEARSLGSDTEDAVSKADRIAEQVMDYIQQGPTLAEQRDRLLAIHAELIKAGATHVLNALKDKGLEGISVHAVSRILEIYIRAGTPITEHMETQADPRDFLSGRMVRVIV